MTTDDPLGVLELTGKGSGFVRRRTANYRPSRDDIHVGQKLIRQYDLRTGDELAGTVGQPRGRGKNPPLARVALINGRPPNEVGRRPTFKELPAVHPDCQLVLDCGLTRRGSPDYTNRIVDLLCPFGKGQRALIVSPAKAGKTMVLQAIAEGIVKNYPDCPVFILLVDERPEEVTEMELCGYGEVVASSFDQPPNRHVAVAKLTLERARRRVEHGDDVVIILDSITRLARAYNTVEKGSGRTLSGGLDATSLDEPKKFLGSARRIDPRRGSGSLTIIATALIDTGSRMDDVIFEEFKGTGNSELVLNRELADRRIYPAIDLVRSSTRREELLVSPEVLHVAHTLRQQLANMQPLNAMKELLDLMNQSKSNAELVAEFSTAG